MQSKEKTIQTFGYPKISSYLCIQITEIQLNLDKMKISQLFKKEENFGIVVSRNNVYDINSLLNNEVILRLDIDNLLKVKPLLTQADPFLFVKGEKLYLFYEEMRSGERGKICMRKMTNDAKWSNSVVVLKEDFHLSFPFVFEDKGTVYMIPESQEVDSIRLYKGNDNLSQFSLVKTLLNRERTSNICFNFCDNHLVLKDGIYYLFTSVAYNWTYHLELYYTDDLLHNDFIKHPQSPIYIGNDYGRSGGSILHLDNNYYRISQNCRNSYGANISIHHIIKLDKNYYEEELIKTNVFDDSNDIYREGGHQLHIVKYGDNYIYATDYRRVSWCWYQSFLRIKNHIKKLS